jgi:PAS domain S-box-containing protein
MALTLAIRPGDANNRPDPALPRPARPETAASVEARLKLLIESLPAGVTLASPEGKILAANRDALTLVGAAKLEDVLGTSLFDRILPEHRERFVAFLGQVCGGQAAALEYELAGPEATRRLVETRAVPLSRGGSTPAAFLGVTWDLTERQRGVAAGLHQAHARCVLLEAQLQAQRDAYESALRDAKAACDQIAHERVTERQTLSETFKEERARLQASVAEKESQHERAAAEWQSEREELNARLRAAEARHISASAQAVAEQHARQLEMVAALEARHRGELEARAADFERLDAALKDARRQLGELDEERMIERAQFEADLRSERSQVESALRQRELWQMRLTEMLEELIGSSNAHTVRERVVVPVVPVTHAAPPAQADATGTDDPAEGSQWAI